MITKQIAKRFDCRIAEKNSLQFGGAAMRAHREDIE